jgi:peptidoglycan biosynthesis protein MviN/MurJ (putative lipid II flippase)
MKHAPTRPVGLSPLNTALDLPMGVRRSEERSNVRRTLLVLSTCSILSYEMAFTGYRFVYSHFAGRRADDEVDFIVITAIGVCLVLPAVSVLVGIMASLLEQDNRWWLSGLSMAPLLLYLIYRAPMGPVIILCLIYEALGLITGYGVMKLRHKYRVLMQV